MMTCKEVSTLVSTGEWSSVPARQRLAVWLHLAMCRHCRAFRQQLEALAGAARLAGSAYLAEPSSAFEQTIGARLQK